MATLLVKNATTLVTMGAARRALVATGQFARDGVIEQVDPTSALPASADPVAALVLCHPVNARYVAMQGRLIVAEGQLATADLPIIVENHNRQARASVRAE